MLTGMKLPFEANVIELACFLLLLIMYSFGKPNMVTMSWIKKNMKYTISPKSVIPCKEEMINLFIAVIFKFDYHKLISNIIEKQ